MRGHQEIERDIKQLALGQTLPESVIKEMREGERRLKEGV